MATPAPAPTGIGLRTTLWLGGAGFIAAGGAALAAALRFNLPWPGVVALLGGLAGLVVLALEATIAAPLEALAQNRPPTESMGASPPSSPPRRAPLELRALWQAARAWQERVTHLRLALEAARRAADRGLAPRRWLGAAAAATRPGADPVRLFPPAMADLAAHLGAARAHLVPLRRRSHVPVLGSAGVPPWSDEVRSAGLSAWGPLLDQEAPSAICLNPFAGTWTRHFGQATLWVVPLRYHGRAQGLILIEPGAVDRAWTPEERALLTDLGALFGAALYAPVWTEAQRVSSSPEEDEAEGLRLTPLDDRLARKAKRRRR